MTRTRPPTTSEIVALYVLNRRTDQLAVDWAVDLLVREYDTPALRQLAGESEPFDWYEVEKLLKRIFRDLKIIIPERIAAHVLLVSERIRQLLAGEASTEETLSKLMQLYYALEEPKELLDFYLLANARAGFALGEESPISPDNYWPGSTRENIDQIVIKKCRKWLEEHGASIELPELEES